MFERFTARARTAVQDAVVIADEQAAPEVRPEHVFAAMLRDDDSLAVRVLADLGAPADRLRADLEQRRGRYLDGLGDDDAEALATIGIDLEAVLRRVDLTRDTDARRRRRHPRFAKASKKALELALREAIALGHNYIGTEHLLLGMVRGGDPVVRDTLVACDVAPDQLRGAVRDAVRRAG